MALRKTPILLLKTKSSPKDAYDEYFSTPANGSYDPRFVPVLDHRFKEDGVASLRNSIEGGAFLQRKVIGHDNSTRYGGLIFTSQRAVEAFTAVIKDLRDASISVENYFSVHMPIYVVGPATARSVRALNLPCEVVGEDTGNGDALAEFILHDYNIVRHSATAKSDTQSHTSSPKPGLLFLVGEQRRDVISRTLLSEELSVEDRIAVTELTVYETAVMESFEGDFADQIQPALREDLPLWVVVFSPTGCKIMLETLNLLNSQTGKTQSTARSEKRNVKIATIGPTTRDYLIREFDFDPDVCASRPSPEGLGDSIKELRITHFEINL